jgi:hypothetical protein
MQHNLTIVSGFIADINKTRSLDLYLKHGQVLMTIKIPKVIFIDETIIDRISNPLPEYNTIIPFKFSDMYYYPYMDVLKSNVRYNTNSPTKDSIEYMMIQCYKTEWMRRAIELDLYHTEQYMWIDFGIHHVFEKSVDSISHLHQLVHSVENYKTSLVRIPFMNLFYIEQYDPYRWPCWYFAGGVFGGHKDSLIKFADYMKEYCLRIIKEKNWIMWEINIWAFIRKDHKELFDLYYGGHDDSIFLNYTSSQHQE